MSYALVELKIPVKIPLTGERLTASVTKDISLTLKSFLSQGQGTIVNVAEHLGQLEDLVYDYESDIKVPGTYFVVSIQLDHHQREDWKTFDALILQKVIDELESEDLHISNHSENADETFIAFVKNYD